MFLAESTFFWSSVCISRSLYLSMSLATYVRLSLELVCLLDALQWYLKNSMLNRHEQQTWAALTWEGTWQREVEAGAQFLGTVASDRAFQRYFHQVFPSQFIYFWIPLHSRQKQFDNKIRQCCMGTTTLLRKTLTQLFFFTSYVSEIRGWVILVENQVMSVCLSPVYYLIYFGK